MSLVLYAHSSNTALRGDDHPEEGSAAREEAQDDDDREVEDGRCRTCGQWVAVAGTVRMDATYFRLLAAIAASIDSSSSATTHAILPAHHTTSTSTTTSTAGQKMLTSDTSGDTTCDTMAQNMLTDPKTLITSPVLRAITDNNNNNNIDGGASSYVKHAASSHHLPPSTFNKGYYANFFRQIKKLGRGFRGSVYLVQHVLENVILGDYAVKTIPVGDDKLWLTRMLQEVYTLERLRHVNVIEYKHCWVEDHQLSVFGPPVPCLFILMELANGGNLAEYVQRVSNTTDGPLTPDEAKARFRRKKSCDDQRVLLSNQEIWSFFLDICAGLDHLHKHGILHRDLKPSNLLLKYQTPNHTHEIPRILISDFGESENLFSSENVRERTGATGTLEFMAPELLRTDQYGRYYVEYTPASDLWSLGMILFFLCFSRLPYRGVDDLDMLRLEILAYRKVDIPKDGTTETLSPEFPHLIRMLLSYNPRHRPSASEILASFSHKRGQGRSRRRCMSTSENSISEEVQDVSSSETTVQPIANLRSLMPPTTLADVSDEKKTEETKTVKSKQLEQTQAMSNDGPVTVPPQFLFIVKILLLYFSCQPYAPSFHAMVSLTIVAFSDFFLKGWLLAWSQVAYIGVTLWLHYNSQMCFVYNK